MQLKLEKLQKIANDVLREEKKLEALKKELTRSIGPVVVTNYGLKVMAETANDHLDVILMSGKIPGPINISVLEKFITSNEPAARRLVARLLPESFVRRMMHDSDEYVRHVVAERLSSYDVKLMLKKHPNDDHLVSIYGKKKLQEAGIANPVISDEEFDVNGDVPLSTFNASEDHPGMTDSWYDSLARDFIKNYGLNLENNWEEKSVKSYCNSMKSQGVEVDSEKLIKTIYDYLDQRDENMLLTTVSNLRKSQDIDEVFIPVISNEVDQVKKLMQENATGQSYIHSFEELFQVKKEHVENPGKKAGIYESYSRITVPSTGILPSGKIREVDERALDKYVKCWNSQRRIRNQPYQISWCPGDKNEVRFFVGLS